MAGVKNRSGTAPADLDDATEDDIIDAMRRFELGTDTAPNPANDDDTLHRDVSATAHNVAAHPAPVVAVDPAAGMPNEAEIAPPAAATAKRGKTRGVGDGTVMTRTTRSRRAA